MASGEDNKTTLDPITPDAIPSLEISVSQPTTTQKWLLWIFYALVIYVQGLSSFTLSVYLNTAASLFNGNIQYTTISTVQAIIYGVANAAFAKIADVFGRPMILAGSIGSYALGTIVLATAQNIGTLSAGMIFFSFGNTGINFSTNIIIADLIPAHWRCTVTNLTLMPFIINFGIGSKITGALVPDQWRWGIGMFAILVPVTATPLAFYLFSIARRVSRSEETPKLTLARLRIVVSSLDLPGLFLLLIGFGLLLLPLTIADQAPRGYGTGYIIAMFVLGGVALVAFPFVESWVSYPAVNLRRLRHVDSGIDVIIATSISMADALSTMVAFTPSYNWVRITFDYSVQHATYYLYAGSLAVVIFGIAGGLVATATRRYKWLTVFGGATRLMALGLMYRYRGPESSTAQIIIPQILQGLGGAVMTANLLVAAQISVPHADVAMVTGIFLMAGGVADAAGSAIAGAIQQQLLPALREFLASTADDAAIQAIYEQGYLALDPDYPLGSPVRTGAILAWEKNTRQILATAIAIAGLNFLLCFALKDRVLPETQNRVTDEDTGLPVPMIEADRAKTVDA